MSNPMTIHDREQQAKERRVYGVLVDAIVSEVERELIKIRAARYADDAAPAVLAAIERLGKAKFWELAKG